MNGFTPQSVTTPQVASSNSNGSAVKRITFLYSGISEVSIGLITPASFIGAEISEPATIRSYCFVPPAASLAIASAADDMYDALTGTPHFSSNGFRSSVGASPSHVYRFSALHFLGSPLSDAVVDSPPPSLLVLSPPLLLLLSEP